MADFRERQASPGLARMRGRVALRAKRMEPPHSVLCVLPRRLPVNPLKRPLAQYDLAAADTWTAALRLARNRAYDLYVVYAPLGWSDSTEICRRIRTFDAHTPVILYSMQASAAERQETMALGSLRAYVARSDDANNLAGTAGQLIMLAELRSMEAMKSGVEAMRTHIAGCLEKLERDGNPRSTPPARSQARLKIEACRLFALAGGSRSNFERLWPSIYEGAVKCRPAEHT